MIGEILKAARMRQGLSLGALALRAGVNKSTLSRWESGKTVPYALELGHVMDALELSPSARQKCWQSLDAPRAVMVAQKSAGSGAAPMSTGELLRALRVRSAVSQEEAARAAGVTQGMVSRWEAGECWPEGDRLHGLCYALGATAEELVFLTVRGWQQQEPLPDDKDALDAVVTHLEAHDPSRNRGLVYLALGARYQTLYQKGKISEVEATDIWGTYGHYLAWRLLRFDDALRVAAPALATLRGSSRSLTKGQLEAVNALALSEKRPTQRNTVLATLTEVAPRVPREHHSWWLSIHSETLESMGHVHQAMSLTQEAIRSAPKESTANQYQLRYVEMLCRHGRYREAHTYLMPPDPQESRLALIVQNLINHATTLAGLGEYTEAQRYFAQTLALHKRHGLEVAEDILRLEHWLSA